MNSFSSLRKFCICLWPLTGLFNILAERLLNPKTKEKYKEFTGDLFGHGILTYNDSNELDKAQKDIQEEKLKQPKMLEKEEDDYEL